MDPENKDFEHCLFIRNGRRAYYLHFGAANKRQEWLDLLTTAIEIASKNNKVIRIDSLRKFVTERQKLESMMKSGHMVVTKCPLFIMDSKFCL